MKKKVAIILVTIILLTICVVLCSCFDEEYVNKIFGERFGLVEVINEYTIIIYDKETMVEYLYMTNNYRAVLTVLLDENGKPLLYEGKIK